MASGFLSVQGFRETGAQEKEESAAGKAVRLCFAEVLYLH